MPISSQEVQHIAKLARVGLSEEDVAKFQQQLSSILDYFETLRRLDTEGIPPTSHTLALTNVTRDDAPRPPFHKEAVFANAPQREGDHFRVKAVLE